MESNPNYHHMIQVHRDSRLLLLELRDCMDLSYHITIFDSVTSCALLIVGGGCDCTSILLTHNIFRVKKHDVGRTGESGFIHL